MTPAWSRRSGGAGAGCMLVRRAATFTRPPRPRVLGARPMRICVAPVAAALVAAASYAGAPVARAADRVADPAAVVAAERAFARASIEHGMKDAFLANLAADAIVFRPGPVPAVEWFRSRPASKGRLEWAPDVAAIASGGDLGFTAGPWRWQDPSGAASFGHYVTVW